MSCFPRASRYSTALLLTCLLLVISAGCGDSGPKTYEVSGKITFKGDPVPKGYITFSPDTSKGNSGPGGGAMIEDGVYRTDKGKGIVGGHYIVKIVGYDGIATTMNGEELLDGKPFFDPYETNVEFPQEDVERDFQVPESNAVKLP